LRYAADPTLARRSEVAVRATTTILRVFKANGAQFVYQKGARRRSPGAASRLIRPAAMIRGPFGPWAGCRAERPGESGDRGNHMFTMTPKYRSLKRGSCRKGSQTLAPRAIELSVHLSRL
jgi:hypothetical protein